jgi:predicted class III extradiol MEMO1 family dioxygenase
MRAGLQGMTSRPPAVAGQFYPGDPDLLRTQVLELLAKRTSHAWFEVKEAVKFGGLANLKVITPSIH